ncbi:MAG: hypothetical protein AABN33_29670 [Acidobacteriota bacterium]
MKNTAEHNSSPMPATAKWVVVVFVLAGLLLIAVSVTITDAFWKDLLKELGIVLLAVFVISWLYEIAVAEKYFTTFSRRLRDIIESGESLAAACQQLGIIRIFPRRDDFDRDHPITDMVARLGDGGTLRIVARSLFHIANKPEVLKAALSRGFQVELCICDSAVSDQNVLSLTDTQPADIQAALGAFRSEIVPWLQEKKPSGSVEVKTHTHLLFDSFLHIESGSMGWVVLDLSFGRDLSAKRVFLIDAFKPFGLDLKRRYDRFWRQATTVFKYAHSGVALNSLDTPSNLPHAP